MAQGKKKRKIKDIKNNTKKEPIKKIEESKETPKRKNETQKEEKTTTKQTTNKKTEVKKKEPQKKKEQENPPKKKTTQTEKKKQETAKKTTEKKKRSTTTKEEQKIKSSKEKKKPTPLQEKKAKETKKTKKWNIQQIQEIGKKVLILFLTFLKKLKQCAKKFLDFSKVQTKKGKQLLKKGFATLKIVLNKIKNRLHVFYEFLKEKYKVWKEKRKKKKEEKRSKKLILKEQKENNKKILIYQKEQTLLSNAKNKKGIEEPKEEEKTEKKKKHFPKSLVILGGFLILYFVATTLPYGIKEYVSGASGKIIDVPKLTKLKEECCNYKATFTSIRSIKSLEKEMEKLLLSYQKLNCDNKSYVYNEKGDYTITEYSLKKGTIFNELTITYGKGNSCELDTTFKRLEFLPNSFSIEDAKKDGNYVIDKEKVYNPEAYTKFMEEVEKKNITTLRIVKTTEEGDLLITDVEYLKEGKFKVTYDKTRDRNNKDNYIMAYKYDHIGIYKNKLYAYNGSSLNNDVIKSKNAYYLIDIPNE